MITKARLYIWSVNVHCTNICQGTLHARVILVFEDYRCETMSFLSLNHSGQADKQSLKHCVSVLKGQEIQIGM